MANDDQPKKVIYEISLISVLKVPLLLFGLWILYLIRDVLLILLVVGVIAVALEPFVEKLAIHKIPRALSVIVMYLAILVILGLFVYFIVPPVANQLSEFSLNLPYYTDKLSHLDFGSATGTVNNIVNGLSDKIAPATGGLISAIVSIFGGVVSTVMVFVLTFYLLVEEEGIRRSVVNLVPVAHKAKLLATINKVSFKIGGWLRGQLSLMLIVGFVDGIALSILGVNFALVLGLMSGLLEVVPVVGPVVAALISIVVAFITGVAFWKILVIVAIYILVQQLENAILVPKIMQKAVGLSPVVVILAILIGSKLIGITGAILALPITVGLQVFLNEYFPRKKEV